MRIPDINSLPEDHPIRKQLEEKGETTAPKKKKTTSKRNDFEHMLQARAIKYFRVKYPDYKKSLFAVPNMGKRSPRVGKYFKDEGLLAGVWDLFLCIPKGGYGGCFIETKWGDNTLTDTQKTFREANNEFYHFFVYRSLDEFIKGIEQYFKL